MIQTVLGPIENNELGITVSHEHIMVGFIEKGKLSDKDYNRHEVIEIMLPYLLKLKESGCRSFVDCGPKYLGRDPYILRELSIKSGMNILTNTGLYKVPYLPDFAYEMSEEQLADIWVDEFRHGIEGSGIKPGFIKIAVTDGHVIPIQEKMVRAAVLTSIETGLAIQCHTVGGSAIAQVYDILSEMNFNVESFIWVHADSETDLSYHKKLGGLGMWIEIDCIGSRPYDEHCHMLKQLVAAGLEDKILISQDSGWYHVGEERGGNIRTYHQLFTEFIPLALKNGIPMDILHKFTVLNPAKAFNIRKRV